MFLTAVVHRCTRTFSYIPLALIFWVQCRIAEQDARKRADRASIKQREEEERIEQEALEREARKREEEERKAAEKAAKLALAEEKANKEAREQEQLLKSEAKRVEYFPRALWEAARSDIESYLEDRLEEDRQYYDAKVSERQQKLAAKHARDLASKNTLRVLEPYVASFVEQHIERNTPIFEAECERVIAAQREQWIKAKIKRAKENKRRRQVMEQRAAQVEAARGGGPRDDFVPRDRHEAAAMDYERGWR